MGTEKTSNTILTQEQAKKAHQVVFHLIQKRRIFLARDNTLDPLIFDRCITLYEQLKKAYRDGESLARIFIQDKEKHLEVTPPTLRDGQNIVTCSMYSGGLEICGVYPLGQFLAFMPGSYEALLYDQIFLQLHGKIGGIVPDELPKKNEEMKILVDSLWKELQAIANIKDGVVLLMETRFHLDERKDFSVLKDTIRDLTPYPLGLAYLFFLHECVTRTVRHHYVLFSCERNDHPRVSHWSDDDEPPKLRFGISNGYDCTVKLACLI